MMNDESESDIHTISWFAFYPDAVYKLQWPTVYDYFGRREIEINEIHV